MTREDSDFVFFSFVILFLFFLKDRVEDFLRYAAVVCRDYVIVGKSFEEGKSIDFCICFGE